MSHSFPSRRSSDLFGARISYSAETQALETAGGIAQALDFFQDQAFLVINGDVWCDWNPTRAGAIAADLHTQGKQAWLLMVDNPPQHPDGDFHLAHRSEEPTSELQSLMRIPY